MTDQQDFFRNKIEEALQLLAAHSELLERQNHLLQEFLARVERLEADCAGRQG